MADLSQSETIDVTDKKASLLRQQNHKKRGIIRDGLRFAGWLLGAWLVLDMLFSQQAAVPSASEKFESAVAMAPIKSLTELEQFWQKQPQIVDTAIGGIVKEHNQYHAETHFQLSIDPEKPLPVAELINGALQLVQEGKPLPTQLRGYQSTVQSEQLFNAFLDDHPADDHLQMLLTRVADKNLLQDFNLPDMGYPLPKAVNQPKSLNANEQLSDLREWSAGLKSVWWLHLASFVDGETALQVEAAMIQRGYRVSVEVSDGWRSRISTPAVEHIEKSADSAVVINKSDAIDLIKVEDTTEVPEPLIEQTDEATDEIEMQQQAGILQAIVLHEKEVVSEDDEEAMVKGRRYRLMLGPFLLYQQASAWQPAMAKLFKSTVNESDNSSSSGGNHLQKIHPTVVRFIP